MSHSADTPKKPFNIAVIGGGIGGLCTTIGLLHQNIPCTLYEAAPAFAEIGAGVSFGPNALRAMSLIDPAIQRGYSKRATTNAWSSKKDTWFDFRIGQKDWPDHKDMEGRVGELVASPVAVGVGQNSVHRAHFLDELVALVPDGVAVFGKRLDDIKSAEDGSGALVMHFQDGTTAVADAIIGCDGVKSRTRQILLGIDHPATTPTFSGKYAYRGLIPMPKAVDAIGEELARNSQMYMGHHGHVLTFPIEKGDTMNVVAFRTKSDGKWDDERWVLPMKKEDMYKDFEGWGDDVKKILSLMEKPDVWALFDHPPSPTYITRPSTTNPNPNQHQNLCILGDAAHASTPHQGAGAGQAIEDAFILSNLLGQIASAKDIPKAFHAYDEVRRPRSQKVVTTSRQAAGIYEFESEEVGFDLERAKVCLEERLAWIWEEDLQEQLERAVRIMRA